MVVRAGILALIAAEYPAVERCAKFALVLYGSARYAATSVDMSLGYGLVWTCLYATSAYSAVARCKRSVVAVENSIGNYLPEHDVAAIVGRYEQ